MSESSPDLKYWVAFSRISRVGAVRMQRLESYFDSMAEAWTAGPNELRQAGLDSGTIQSIVELRPTISPDGEIEALHKANVTALCWADAAYPPRLKEIDDRPPVLYVRGELTPEDEWAVAIVGTRRASPYGRQAAEHFATDLAHHKITVVSGLARGVDAVAHRAVLAAGGRTIAVQACGLDLVYPPEHAKMAAQIAENGAVVSDYPLGTQPRSEFFPRRNRILSALSLGVLVVEGDIDSGSLITARMALDQNREVFAVPGSIYSPTHRGVNKLIREGNAKLVDSTQQILEELNVTVVSHQPAMALHEPQAVFVDAVEEKVWRALSHEPTHIDEVKRVSGLTIEQVSSVLALLELKGRVKATGSMSFVRSREVPA